MKKINEQKQSTQERVGDIVLTALSNPIFWTILAGVSLCKFLLRLARFSNMKL